MSKTTSANELLRVARIVYASSLTAQTYDRIYLHRASLALQRRAQNVAGGVSVPTLASPSSQSLGTDSPRAAP